MYLHSELYMCSYATIIIYTVYCRELQCVPDIWSLVEWSDWLTPRNMHRRYDTVFYLCFLETRPHIAEDGKEVVDAKVKVQCEWVDHRSPPILQCKHCSIVIPVDCMYMF